ncbi:MAG: hypothetical protein M1368_08995 [Thaumarchaeota archaeon]|nr:hypothetical protein [Nitrososphaerota archaeon]
MKEDDAVSKVEELMETLDHVKRYRELSSSLKSFVLIAGGSILAFILIRILLVILTLLSLLGGNSAYLISFVALMIPLAGVILGILHVRRRVNSVKGGEWKQTLAQGFPGALELLSGIDWQSKLDEISDVKQISLLYGLAKLSSYSILVFFLTALIAPPAPTNFSIAIVSLLAVSLVISLGIGGKEAVKRYREAKSLDFLLHELRSFYNEFKGSEFEIKA